MKNNQNIAIIDIGSNSVRERISCNGKVFLRRVITTQLAKNAQNGCLNEASVLRTFEGLDLLFSLAREHKAKVFAFATAAVRNAKNKEDFISKFNSKYGEKLDVLSGENEGKMGVLGALKGKSGCIIDVGGASSEVVCSFNEKVIYAHSMQVGAVSLTDKCGKDFSLAYEFLTKQIEKEFDKIPKEIGEVYGIGGSANSVAFIKSGLKSYNREATNGIVVDNNYLFELAKKFYLMDSKQISAEFLIDNLRSNVIHSGTLILACLLNKLCVTKIILTEDDNLEGYYLWLEQNGKI